MSSRSILQFRNFLQNQTRQLSGYVSHTKTAHLMVFDDNQIYLCKTTLLCPAASAPWPVVVQKGSTNSEMGHIIYLILYPTCRICKGLLVVSYVTEVTNADMWSENDQSDFRQWWFVVVYPMHYKDLVCYSVTRVYILFTTREENGIWKYSLWLLLLLGLHEEVFELWERAAHPILCGWLEVACS